LFLASFSSGIDLPKLTLLLDSGEVLMRNMSSSVGALYASSLTEAQDLTDATHAHLRVLWATGVSSLAGLLLLVFLAGLGVFTSRTRARLRRRNNNLTTALEAAEEARKLKAAFLANISHELRTVSGVEATTIVEELASSMVML
jgi:signal transduction histidine kinase